VLSTLPMPKQPNDVMEMSIFSTETHHHQPIKKCHQFNNSKTIHHKIFLQNCFQLADKQQQHDVDDLDKYCL